MYNEEAKSLISRIIGYLENFRFFKFQYGLAANAKNAYFVTDLSLSSANYLEENFLIKTFIRLFQNLLTN